MTPADFLYQDDGWSLMIFPVSERAKQFLAKHYPKAARYKVIVFAKNGYARPFIEAVYKAGLTFAEEISVAEAELRRLYALHDPRPSEPSDEEARVVSELYRIATGIGLTGYHGLVKTMMAGEDTVDESGIVGGFRSDSTWLDRILG